MTKIYKEYKCIPVVDGCGDCWSAHLEWQYSGDIGLNEDMIESEHNMEVVQEGTVYKFRHVTMQSGKEHFLLKESEV